MKKKYIALLLCASMIATAFAGCGKKTSSETSDSAKESVISDVETVDSAATENAADDGEMKTLTRPSLVGNLPLHGYDENLVPSVPSYSVDASFSNVINAADFVGGEYVREEFKDKLAKNLFVVSGESGHEFWEQYEFNAYSQTPNFVTVDSLMHTYHLYFAHLLKTIEKTYLIEKCGNISSNMLSKSIEQYEEYKGTEWEDAAKRCVEYFGVACTLSGISVDIPDYAREVVDAEVAKVMDASEVDNSLVVPNLYEDYSQYKPRGYYEGDEALEKYFRTMMWFGRITFDALNEDNTRAAVLMSMALKDVAIDDWEAVYAVTSFFAGASDDLGYCEYMPAIEKSYGVSPAKQELVGNDGAWKTLNDYISKMDPPKIQSIPVFEDEENVIPGFRLMGQRFTIDANIMQNLIYRAVDKNENEEARMLPTVLDVPAALGSDMALEIANSNGASAFPDYAVNMERLRKELADPSDNIWYSSLYAQWLGTLRPLLVEKGEGYPSFMTNNEWTKKTIETFAGSYTELKHDTILYAKQPMAEMGGGDIDPVDDRGYVEPEPLVYARFKNLAEATSRGLKNYGMISSADENNLELLYKLADSLLIISQKELRNELPTDDEFELIRNYGGNIEHFWYEAMKSEADSEYFTAEEYPAGLVVDVATDPNGTVLEAGTGNPCEIVVVVPVDGILRIACGSVYNFYEFNWPLSDRLTDSKWREMVGIDPGAGFIYEKDESIVNPDWTLSYREERWHWEW